MGQTQPFQRQPYHSHTYQVLVQPHTSMIYLGYPGGIPIPTAQAIPRYLRYPLPWVGLNPQGYQTLPQYLRWKLQFITTLDLPDYQVTKLPSVIPKFEGKSGEDPSNHVMTSHIWCASNYLINDSIHLCLFQ